MITLTYAAVLLGMEFFKNSQNSGDIHDIMKDIVTNFDGEKLQIGCAFAESMVFATFTFTILIDQLSEVTNRICVKEYIKYH